MSCKQICIFRFNTEMPVNKHRYSVSLDLIKMPCQHRCLVRNRYEAKCSVVHTVHTTEEACS